MGELELFDQSAPDQDREGLSRRAVLAAAGVIGLSCALGACGGGEQSPPPSTPYEIGLALGDSLFGTTDSDGMFHQYTTDEVAMYVGWAKKLGARIIRFDFDNNIADPKNTGDYDWSFMRNILRAAADQELAVMGTIWYVPPANRVKVDAYNSYPKDPAGLARFAGKAVRICEEYGVPFYEFEVGNEENLAPGGDPEAYVDTFRIVTDAVKAVNDKRAVAIGGLGPADSGQVTPMQFLDAILGAGIRHYDAIGDHPYEYYFEPDTPNPQSPFTQIEGSSQFPYMATIYEVLQKYRIPHTPLWLNEMGAPTDGTGAEITAENPRPANWNWNTSYVDQQRQSVVVAQSLTHEFRYVNVIRRMIYTGWDTPGSAIGDHFGLLYSNGAPKEAAATFTRIARTAS